MVVGSAGQARRPGARGARWLDAPDATAL